MDVAAVETHRCKKNRHECESKLQNAETHHISLLPPPSSLCQVQRSSDEASAGSECRQPVREAPPSSEQGGVCSWKASVTETGNDPELTTSLTH